MDQRNTIGIDVGDRHSDVCVLDAAGEVTETSKIRSTQEGFTAYFGKLSEPCVTALEAGCHSPWMSRLLSDLGHEVIVANARKLALINKSHDKSDRNDAELLARLARADKKLLSPITHRKEKTQEHLSLLRARFALVASRTKLVNHVRGAVKTAGHRMPGGAANAFHKKVESLPDPLKEGLTPLMETIGELTTRVRSMDKKIEQVLKANYSEADGIRTIHGVGPLTTLAFILIIEDPHRFAKSRSVGAFVGLCPRRYQSSNSDPQLRISKTGDRELRRLLVGCAQYIMGPFGKDSDLRTWGFALAERGGKNAKRRAIVAVARKLTVIMHQLWLTGEVYHPHRNQAAAA